MKFQGRPAQSSHFCEISELRLRLSNWKAFVEYLLWFFNFPQAHPRSSRRESPFAKSIFWREGEVKIYRNFNSHRQHGTRVFLDLVEIVDCWILCKKEATT